LTPIATPAAALSTRGEALNKRSSGGPTWLIGAVLLEQNDEWLL
jgi:hypothetical protein